MKTVFGRSQIRVPHSVHTASRAARRYGAASLIVALAARWAARVGRACDTDIRLPPAQSWDAAPRRYSKMYKLLLVLASAQALKRPQRALAVRGGEIDPIQIG